MTMVNAIESFLFVYFVRQKKQTMIYIQRKLRLIQNGTPKGLGFLIGMHRDLLLLLTMEGFLKIIYRNEHNFVRKYIV